MKTTKYEYSKVIQQNTGNGWDDVSSYECNSKGVVTEMSGVFVTSSITGRKRERTLLLHDLLEYQLGGYPTRVIFRKELRQTA